MVDEEGEVDQVRPGRSATAAQKDFLAWVGHGDQSADGRTMAMLRGSPRSEAPFNLVVVDLDTGDEITEVPLPGARHDTVTRIDWNGQTAVVSFTGRPPVLVSIDGTMTGLATTGTATMQP